ncbi:MAG: ATP-binding protein [Lachnospiraceae bacterium]|nr:ATP-binding protein [Lachnospiraceae bacterium]
MSLSNAEYRDIINQLDEVRTKNQLIHEERLKEVYKKHPDIKALQDEIVSLCVSRIKGLSADSSDSTQAEIKRLSDKKLDLLESYGYPRDYFAPIYDCPKCNDTGFIDNEPCICYKKRAIAKLYDQSNLSAVLNRENFDTFNLELYNDESPYSDKINRTPRENMRRVYNISKDFINNFDEKFENLLVYGKTGVGKTFLTHCIAKELLDSSHTVLYISSIDLFKKIEKYRFKNVDDTAYDYIINSDLLIIDDLGSELVNSFTDSELYNIINLRILYSRSTIISTNLEFDGLKNLYSERVFSRFLGSYTFCPIVGKDLRL